MQDMARNGAALSATAYYAAVDAITQLRQRMQVFFARYDLILTPSIAALPGPRPSRFRRPLTASPPVRAAMRYSRPSPTWVAAPRSACLARRRKADCRSASSLSARSDRTRRCSTLRLSLSERARGPSEVQCDLPVIARCRLLLLRRSLDECAALHDQRHMPALRGQQ